MKVKKENAMKRLIFLFCVFMAMFFMSSCDDGGVADSPPPMYFNFEVYNSLGEDLVSSGKIRDIYPNLRIVFDGESIPLEYSASNDTCSSRRGLRFYASRDNDNGLFLFFGIFFKEEKQSFVVDWGDGTLTRIYFSCDWNDVGSTMLFVDGKPVSVRSSREIFYRFIKG